MESNKNGGHKENSHNPSDCTFRKDLVEEMVPLVTLEKK